LAVEGNLELEVLFLVVNGWIDPCLKEACEPLAGRMIHQVYQELLAFQKLHLEVTRDIPGQNVCECGCEHGVMVGEIVGIPLLRKGMVNPSFLQHLE
jgi:hypothetical protein